MKREKSWLTGFGPWVRATEWLAVVVPFTERGTRKGGAGLGGKVKDMLWCL